MSGAMTRREFVTAGAVAAARAALAATGMLGAATDEGDEVETPSTSYGGDGEMGKRVLVGYATRTGSTDGRGRGDRRDARRSAGSRST